VPQEVTGKPAPTITAALAVRDEEAVIGNCLDLLDFVDEIVVVVDDRTTDATAAIAAGYTQNVPLRPFSDFAEQKNHALEQASCDWVLLVDADERVTPALAQEIQDAVRSSGTAVAYEIPRVHFFFGRRFRHGDWDDAPVRLVRRGAGRYRGKIHEVMSVEGSVGRLSQPLWHFTHRDIESMLQKTVVFGRLQAEELAESEYPRVTVGKLTRVLLRELYGRLLRSGGWRDGMEGFVESMYQPFSLFCVQVMLWERQLKPSLRERYEQLEAEARRTM
jgi:glycosyltransferase involved in cell wall biosynthesis